MRRILVTICASSMMVLAAPTVTYAEDVVGLPESYVMEAASPGGSWWKVESRILVQEDGEDFFMRGLECAVRYNREGTPPMEIIILHPVESASYNFRIDFNLQDDNLSNRQVETITVGGRPYQRKQIQSRMIPAFDSRRAPDGIILSYGISRDMFRPNEDYPWLPTEFLIPQFFEVEGINLGVAGDFETEHGEYEKRYENIYIDMEGFRDSMKWCYDHINPPGDRKLSLPAELEKRLRK